MSKASGYTREPLNQSLFHLLKNGGLLFDRRDDLPENILQISLTVRRERRRVENSAEQLGVIFLRLHHLPQPLSQVLALTHQLNQLSLLPRIILVVIIFFLHMQHQGCLGL